MSEVLKKLDGVGPVDNKPSTDKLHNFVKKQTKKHDIWHVTHDMWQVTRDMLVGGEGGEHSLKNSAP